LTNKKQFSFIRSSFSKTNKENQKPSEASFAKEKIVPLRVEPEDDRGRKRTKINEGN
jgi:hypothetical protein